VLLAAAGSVAWSQFTDDQVAEDAQTCEFLEQAELVDAEQMPASEGVTEPYKLTLKHGDAERLAVWKNPKGRVGGFLEGWQYEIAAYRLDRHLGLNMVPPTVERRHDGAKGSCQVWVDYWLNMRDKAAKKVDPPGNLVRQFNRSVYLQRAFDNLIANEDRHLGNILITEDWRMILIDHSRSFRSSGRHKKKLIFTAKHSEGPKIMRQLPRAFVEKIGTLDAATLQELVGEYLNEKEIEAVLLRKDLILAEVDRLIAKNGEDKTLY
jgi:hypothetical protein